MPLTLLALALAQSILLLGWRYIGTEMALAPGAQAGLKLRRLTLACALDPDGDWSSLAALGAAIPVPSGDRTLTLTQSAYLAATTQSGSRLYLAQCTGRSRAASGGGQTHIARSGWLLDGDSYRLTLVVPQAPPSEAAP